MKKWETPDMLVLDVKETASGGKKYNKVDGNRWDELKMEHTFTFWPSGDYEADPESEELYQKYLNGELK
ncbi:MAG: hypothetical protein IKP88_03930 [Lachnospiraceae bacterium]|nr:hypothetical protein [Lachnospiraceae bacterium]